MNQMLKTKGYEWRELKTLAHVVGSDERHTKKALLVIGARASEDGKALWALEKLKPFKEK